MTEPKFVENVDVLFIHYAFGMQLLLYLWRARTSHPCETSNPMIHRLAMLLAISLPYYFRQSLVTNNTSHPPNRVLSVLNCWKCLKYWSFTPECYRCPLTEVQRVMHRGVKWRRHFFWAWRDGWCIDFPPKMSAANWHFDVGMSLWIDHALNPHFALHAPTKMMGSDGVISGITALLE